MRFEDGDELASLLADKRGSFLGGTGGAGSASCGGGCSGGGFVVARGLESGELPLEWRCCRLAGRAESTESKELSDAFRFSVYAAGIDGLDRPDLLELRPLWEDL